MLFDLLAALGLMPTFQKTKCKKLLIITMERIKLLEKRRQARVRQLYRDVIALLLLKREHKVDSLLVRIWKELCLFSVYARIAEYCGFVQINLKDIAAQKDCPKGLEEPLAGLCFAASCCADLPELQELREVFDMKYGKQIVSSGKDLEPNWHVNPQLLDCLYAVDPPDTHKQAVLMDIITKYNAMLGHRQSMQHWDPRSYLSTKKPEDIIGCNQSEKGISYLMEVSEVQHQPGNRESQDVDVVQEPNPIKIVGKGDLVSKEPCNGMTTRKRTLEDSEFELSDGVEEEGKGGKEQQNMENAQEACSVAGTMIVSELWCDGHEICGVLQVEGVTAHLNEDTKLSVRFVKRPLCSRPPQRPPPPPPPPPPPQKQATPPPPLRAMSMPGLHYDEQVPANAGVLGRCATMANANCYAKSYTNHVHPRLPEYEDLVATFTALKS